MVKSKKEWKCSNCTATQIVWEGSCRQCSEVGTLEEIILVPPKPTATQSQRKVIRRSKNAERTAASRMIEVDGKDPRFIRIATSTGRVGHITNLQYDTVSKSYVTEVKNRKLPTWLVKAWIQIQQIAIDESKYALLYLEAPNSPKDFILHGVRHKNDAMAVLRQDRHEQFIVQEKKLLMAEEILSSDVSDAQMLYEIKALFGKLMK